MTTLAVVPVQRLETAKSRLAGWLAPGDRAALVLGLLEHVVDALQSAVLVDAVLVVSPDPTVLARAASLGATGVRQTGRGLNEAIELGRSEALRRSADTLLVVLGDLPLLSGSDVDALVAACDEPGIVLAPDRHERGTNALALRPPGALQPAFGDGSLERHRRAAAARGLRVCEYRSRGTGLDIDTGQDLDELERLGVVSVTP